MRLNEKFKAECELRKLAIKPKRSSFDEVNRPDEGFYKEEIRKLQEQIRKCQIEKAELDLKLSQVQGASGNIRESNSVTKILYQENRELRKQIRGLNDELGVWKVERKINRAESRNSVSPFHSQDLSLRTQESTNRYKEKLQEVQSVLFRQKISAAKKVSTLMISNFLKFIQLPCKRTVFDLIKIAELKVKRHFSSQVYKSSNETNLEMFLDFTLKSKKMIKLMKKIKNKEFRSALNKWRIYVQHRISSISTKALANIFNLCSRSDFILKAFNKLKHFSLESKLNELGNKINVYQEKILGYRNKKREVNGMQRQLITVIFIKNLRRIVTKSFRGTVERIHHYYREPIKKLEVCSRMLRNKEKTNQFVFFNRWKHRILDMDINDLCKLHEEQRMEKDYLIEQFDQVHIENSQTIFSKMKLSALRSLNIFKKFSKSTLTSNYICRWHKNSEIISKQKLKLTLAYRLIEGICKIRNSNSFFRIIQSSKVYEKVKKPKNYKAFEIIAMKKLSLLKKVFKYFSILRCKGKLQRKYLEKFQKNKQRKEICMNFRKFYRNCRVYLFSVIKEEGLIMTKTNQFLEESLFTANSVIQESGVVISEFERRMKGKSLKLAFEFNQKNFMFLVGKYFKKWKDTNFSYSNLQKLKSFTLNLSLAKSKYFLKWKYSQTFESNQNPFTIPKFSDFSISSFNQVVRACPFSTPSESYCISRLIKYLNLNKNRQLAESFQSWKIFKDHSEVAELIEHEKLNNYIFKISMILSNCLKNKRNSGFFFWKSRINKTNKTKKIFCKFIHVLGKKLLKNFKHSMKKIINYRVNDDKKVVLRKLERKINENRKLSIRISFFKLKLNVSVNKAFFYKSDCEELLKLANYSEQVIDEKEFKLQKTLNEKKYLKSKVTLLVSQREKTFLLSKCFLGWKSRFYSIKRLSKSMLRILKRETIRKSFSRMKLNRKFQDLNEILINESISLLKFNQDSLDFEISDPSILPFNYKKLTPSFDSKEFRLRSIKIFFLHRNLFVKQTAWCKWIKSCSKNVLKKVISTQTCYSSKSSSTSTSFDLYSSSKKLLKLNLVVNKRLYGEKLLKIFYFKWKSAVVKTLGETQSDSKPEYQEIIKKLLHENMNMAYKLSNAKVASKNFMKKTQELCPNNKENIRP